MLAILTTHPIQYQVPLWQALARDGRVPFEVWYLTDHATQPSRDHEFGKTFSWDIDTLSGYPFRFLRVAEGSSPSGFWKCRLCERLHDRLTTCGVTALWIQGWQVAAYWQAVWEARTAGVEVWLRAESNDLAPIPWWKLPLKRVQLEWLFRRVDRFLYIGAANRRLYQKFGAPESRLYSTPYAVDNDRFSEQAAVLRPCRAELRAKWGIPENAFCVLFSGKFVGKKRPMDLIAAARQLREKRWLPNVHLLFVGSGALGPQLRRSCRVVFDADRSQPLTSLPPHHSPDDPFSPRASFTGFLNQTEISRAYVAADCLVLPSDHRETWGLVVNEALASGLPCLVSDACGCAEELSGGFGLFRMGNITMLASRLRDIADKGGSPAAPPAIADSVRSIVRAYRESLIAAPLQARCTRPSKEPAREL
jgi:glycosyltransferase involved in cell wall biosynthesis